MAEDLGAPVITGLSPTEGTPGTQITIRGENLGVDQNDIQMLFICGIDSLHTAKWKSPTKIIARLGQANRGPGEIKIATKSGGRGTCNVKFRVFIAEIGPLEESSVWVDENRTVPGRETVRKVAAVTEETDALGLRQRKKMEPAQLSQLFEDGCGNLRMESFNPQCYLLENHYETTSVFFYEMVEIYALSGIEDLREGLKNLEMAKFNEEKKSEEMHKAHLYSLISCVNTLADLHRQMEQHKGEMAVASLISNKVSQARQQAENVFRDVLSRKDSADATRNALSLLTRFKFIFFLPKSIDDNMAKGEYSTILNDYTRVKSILKGTEVELFKEVRAEVEERMRKFKDLLTHQLIDSPSSFEQQSKLIKYLKILDPASEPAWDCITSYHCWLEKELWRLQETNHKKALEEQKTESETMDSSSRRTFVAELVHFLEEKLQVFWKLSITFNKVDDGYEDRQKDIDQMLTNTINVSSWLILNALVPEALPKEVQGLNGAAQFGFTCILLSELEEKKKRVRAQYHFVSWPELPSSTWSEVSPSSSRPPPSIRQLMSYTIKTLRSLLSSLLDSQLNQSHVQPLIQLCSTIRLRSIVLTIENGMQAVSNLGSRENWFVVHLDRGASKTCLTDYFEAEVCDCIGSIREDITHSSFPGEVDLFSSEVMRGTLVENVVKLIYSIRLALEKLLNLKRVYDKSEQGNEPTQISPTHLLISICNLKYILDSSLQKILQRLRDSHFKYSDIVYEKSRTKLLNYRESLVTHFISIKKTAMLSIVSSINYDVRERRDEVSEWAKELIMSIVLAQAELLLHAPQLKVECTKVLVHAAITNFLAHLSSHRPKGREACSQCVIDLTAVEEAIGSFLSLETKTLLNAFRADLVQYLDHDKLARCIQSLHSSMRVALCSLNQAAESLHFEEKNESHV